jgi:protein AroM
MVRKVGAITVGQSPRIDVLPDMEPFLQGIEIVQRGALDGMSPKELKAIEPKKEDYILVTRLQDGSSVRIAEKHILPRIQKHMDELIAQGVDGILMLCTGEFPPFSCSKPLLYPQILLRHFVSAVIGDQVLGVLSPDASQIPQSRRRWHENGVEKVYVRAASPYQSFNEVIEEAVHLKEDGAKLLVLDCIGYTQKMKNEIRKRTLLPVVLPRTVAALTTAELFA